MADGLLLWQRLCDDFTADSKGSVEWTNKMNYWSAQIQRLCQTKKTAIFTLPQLTIDLERNGVKPRCLPIVVQELMSQGCFRRLSFLVAELDPSSSSWSFWDFIRNPISFGINWITRKLSRSADHDGDAYVIVGQVQAFADAVHKIMKDSVGIVEPTKNLIDYDWLMDLSKDVVVDESSFRLAILHLERQRTCCVSTGLDAVYGGKVIRLLQPFDDSIPPSSVAVGCLRFQNHDYQLVANCQNRKSETKASRGVQRNADMKDQQRTTCQTHDQINELINSLHHLKSDEQELALCNKLLVLMEWAKNKKKEVQQDIISAYAQLESALKACADMDQAMTREITSRRMQSRDAKVEKAMEKMRSRSRSPRGRSSDEKEKIVDRTV